jgi:hypothetical protein
VQFKKVDYSLKKPAIQTAIPLRRYSYGEFTLTVLGEIESGGDTRYAWVMAVSQGQNPEPGIYLTAEQVAGSGHDMRIIMADGEQLIGHSEQWSDLDMFVEEAVKVVSQVLNLSDETPYQLM